MTEKEAIERLKCMRLFMQIEDKNNTNKFLDEDYVANDMAVSALEKQIPKKPIIYKETNRADCPVCRAAVRGIDKPFGNWCSKCGQALDWN